ncbi:MAG: cyclase family protein [Bryobacteraceae bacterium]
MSAVVATPQTDHQVTKADIDRWMTELSNWGRWGKDDQIGTLNLITPAKRKQALALVKEGYAVSLAHDLDTEKSADNPIPFVHTVLPDTGNFSEDSIQIAHHGPADTHIDALCHAFYQGKMYNGFSQNEVTSKGALKNSILNVKNGIMTRGILIDIARLKGVDYLAPGTPIYSEDLDTWEKKTGVKVSPGDAIFVRTGRWARRAAKGPWNVMRNSAGLHASCARWLHDRGIALLGSDGGSDLIPSQVEDVQVPIHQMALVAMGIHLIDQCDLEALSQASEQRHRWVFLLTAAPIAIPGGTGSLINPIATF